MREGKTPERSAVDEITDGILYQRVDGLVDVNVGAIVNNGDSVWTVCRRNHLLAVSSG